MPRTPTSLDSGLERFPNVYDFELKGALESRLSGEVSSTMVRLRTAFPAYTALPKSPRVGSLPRVPPMLTDG